HRAPGRHQCATAPPALVTSGPAREGRHLVTTIDRSEGAVTKEGDMGLLDILNVMQNGPRGERQPSSSGSGGGMSPIMIALLGLLAYKALKGRGGLVPDPAGTGRPLPFPLAALWIRALRVAGSAIFWAGCCA